MTQRPTKDHRRLILLALFIAATGFVTISPSTYSAAAKQEATAQAEAAEGEDVEELEEIEEIEDLEEIDVEEDVEADEEESEGMPLQMLIGHFHPPLVHFVIAYIFLLVLVEIADVVYGQKQLDTAGRYLLVFTIAAAAVAIFTGYNNMETQPQDPEVLEPIIGHRNVILAAFGMLMIAAILRFKGGIAPVTGVTRQAYIGFIIVASLLIMYGGHLGGKLVYGDDYLPF